MRLYRTTCALSSDDGLCVEMGVSGGGRVAVAVASDHRYGSIVLPELVRSRPFGRLKL